MRFYFRASKVPSSIIGNRKAVVTLARELVAIDASHSLDVTEILMLS